MDIMITELGGHIHAYFTYRRLAYRQEAAA